MPKHETILQTILRSKETVFSFKELALLHNDRAKSLRAKLNYYKKEGHLYHIRRGLYAKDKNYDRFEVATKIFKPSYISFETVLRLAGIIFQYYNSIYVASYRSESIICDGQEYIFRALKPTILTNALGVVIQDTYSIATPERAFLDMLYLHKDYYFDNLGPLNWEKVYEILPVYGNNKRLKKEIDNLYTHYRKEFQVSNDDRYSKA